MAKKSFQRPLPSEHESARKKQENDDLAAAEVRKRERARVKQAFDWMLRQERGRVVWAWLFERCGYNKAGLMRLSGGDVAPLSTEAVAAQREVYRDMRRLVDPEVLVLAEFEAEFGVKLPQAEKGGA